MDKIFFKSYETLFLLFRLDNALLLTSKKCLVTLAGVE